MSAKTHSSTTSTHTVSSLVVKPNQFQSRLCIIYSIISSHIMWFSTAARVMVLGCRDSVLDVYMIECYNSTDGMCPETPACMKLAICPECSPNPCPVEREVIVAGGTDHGSLFISDYKKKGLFCFRESTSWLKFIPDEWKQ